MSKVISANQFLCGVDDLIAMFNALLQKEIDHKLEFRKKVIDKGDPEHFDMCRSGMISIWVNVDKCLVAQDTEKVFKTKIEEAGWNIVDYKWIKNERTDLDQILIRVKPNKQKINYENY